MFAHCSFDATKNKLDCYRGKGCVEGFCKDLREHATKIINYEKKEMIPLTYKEKKNLMKSKKIVIYAKKDLVLMMIMIIKSITKLEIIVIILENIEELLIVFLP